MIIHKCKSIFIHIPKTAGVSLTHAIMTSILGKDTSGEIGNLSDELKYQFLITNQQKHLQAKYYVNNKVISQKNWNNYYKFAIVRNPWDRTISEFFWRHELPDTHKSRKKNRQVPNSFKDFIHDCAMRIADREKPRGIYWSHAQTQKSFVTNDKNKIILDEIFKFEELNEKVFIKRLSIPLELKKLNTSYHQNYRQYYDDKTKDMVYKLYKEDIEMFDYEF